MDEGELPGVVTEYLEAERRLIAWAHSHDDRAVLERLWPLWARYWPPDFIRQVVREAVAEARPAVQCRFAEVEPGVMRLLVAPGNERQAYRHLRDFTQRAEHATIIDPYFFRAERAQVQAVFEHIVETTCLRKAKLKSLHVVHKHHRDGEEGAGDRALQRRVADAAGKNHVRFSHRQTRLFHDRVWIADGQRAVAVGTSLNGLGARAAFILDLPDSDLRDLQSFLRAHRLEARQN